MINTLSTTSVQSFPRGKISTAKCCLKGGLGERQNGGQMFGFCVGINANAYRPTFEAFPFNALLLLLWHTFKAFQRIARNRWAVERPTISQSPSLDLDFER
jgi:hypothetical protein